MRCQPRCDVTCIQVLVGIEYPIFHCHLIFEGRGKSENKKDENIQHNTKQWYRNEFSGKFAQHAQNTKHLD